MRRLSGGEPCGPLVGLWLRLAECIQHCDRSTMPPLFQDPNPEVCARLSQAVKDVGNKTGQWPYSFGVADPWRVKGGTGSRACAVGAKIERKRRLRHVSRNGEKGEGTLSHNIYCLP